MFFKKYIILIFLFFCAFFLKSACFASNFSVNDLIIDNSDKTILIRGKGNYKISKTNSLAPVPTETNAVNTKDDIVTFSTTNPAKYFVDIPNATLSDSNKNYKVKNSKTIQSIDLIQFNPEIVRVVITLFDNKLLQNFKTYSDGNNIIIKYASQLVNNSIQHKFYTLSGDMDKTSIPQSTSLEIIYSNNRTNEIIPKMQNKYYLTMVSQNKKGLILRGIGEISLQKISYFENNTKAEIILDSSGLLPDLENKSYNIPASKTPTVLSINKLNNKKVKITLLGESLRDFRAVISPDNQSLFISHRTNVLNTPFTTENSNVTSYNLTKNSNGYYIFDINFDKPVAYDVFELNGSFYLDIDNLPDYKEKILNTALKNQNFNMQTMKISSDKTRYIISLNNLNFSYANIESNSKSIKLCFKEKPQPKTQDKPQNTQEIVVVPNSNNTKGPQISSLPDIDSQKYEKDESKSGNINVVYVPKDEGDKKIIFKESRRKKSPTPTISALKKVVLDPGHGGTDTGAIGAGTVYEKNLNLTVAKLVEERLKKKNIHVYMTRSTDDFITLEDRVNFSNEISPDIYVSIHANSTVQNVTYGLETHYYKPDSLELANTMHACFASEKNLKKWETKNRGVINSRFYVINHTEAPSVLIEMGFISNKDEREKLLTKQRQEEIADAIADGIFEYLKVKK